MISAATRGAARPAEAIARSQRLQSQDRPSVRVEHPSQGTNLNAAIDDLAYEWASLPNSAGRGWYDGDEGGNKAHGSLQEVTAALEATRARAINPPAS
jgi:hypothetical protein